MSTLSEMLYPACHHPVSHKSFTFGIQDEIYNGQLKVKNLQSQH